MTDNSSDNQPPESSVPDFEDATPARSPVRRAPTARSVPAAQRRAAPGPDFREQAAPPRVSFEEPQPPPAPRVETPLPAPAQPPASPWPKRIAGAVVLLAILAILLGVFLPRNRSEQQPQAGPPGPQPMPAVSPQPTQTTTTVQVQAPQSPQPQPTPNPQTTPRPSPQSQQRALFSQQQAQQLVGQVDAAETAAVNQGFDLLIAELRKEPYQDPEFFEIIGLTLGPMIVQFLGAATPGIPQITNTIMNSKTGFEAAQRLEAARPTSMLPPAIKAQVVNALASGTNYTDALSSANGILKANGIQLSQQAQNTLNQGVAAAAQGGGG